MSVQFSPDGRWFWDGRQWQPTEALAAAQPAPPPVTAGGYEMYSTPATIKLAMGIGIGGAALTGLFGLLLLLIGAAAGDSSSTFAQGFAQGVDQSGSGMDPAQVATFVEIFGAAATGVGVVMAAVNGLLLYLISRRYTWAWIAALALLAMGTAIDLALVATGRGGATFAHVLFIQVPMAGLLLLSPSRRWVGLS